MWTFLDFARANFEYAYKADREEKLSGVEPRMASRLSEKLEQHAINMLRARFETTESSFDINISKNALPFTANLRF